MSGLRGYDSLHGGSWTWEFYPPPYDFLAPANSVPVLPPTLRASGFGCVGRPCTCGGQLQGLGDVGTFFSNLSSGNISDALLGNDFFSGVPNIVAIGVGWWLLSKLSSDVGKAKKSVKRYSAKRRRRAQLQKQLEES